MSFLCSGQPEYGWQKLVAALDATTYMNWRPRIRSLIDKLPATPTEEALKEIHTYSGLLMDGDEVEAWTEIGVEIRMNRVKGVASNARELADVVYQISVPNIGLLQIQRVDVLENSCTDDLQRSLDKGWRILAVCPANDARRPTYIIGHADKHSSD